MLDSFFAGFNNVIHNKTLLFNKGIVASFILEENETCILKEEMEFLLSCTAFVADNINKVRLKQFLMTELSKILGELKCIRFKFIRKAYV